MPESHSKPCVDSRVVDRWSCAAAQRVVVMCACSRWCGLQHNTTRASLLGSAVTLVKTKRVATRTTLHSYELASEVATFPAREGVGEAGQCELVRTEDHRRPAAVCITPKKLHRVQHMK
jgi:hypothetical protein